MSPKIINSSNQIKQIRLINYDLIIFIKNY